MEPEQATPTLDIKLPLSRNQDATPAPLQISSSQKFDPASLLIFSKLNPNIQAELDEKGNLIIMSPTGTDSGRMSSKFHIKLGIWDYQNGEPGELFDSSTGFTLPDSSVRSPDAAWIEKSRYAALNQDEKEKYAQIVPDLIGEIHSKTDRFQDTYEKCKMWLANGVQEVWCIDPGLKIIVMREDEERTFQKDESASSVLLKGFQIKVSDFV